MALQIRRGLQANLPASPADGELLYATDTGNLYIGVSGSPQIISFSGGGGGASAISDLTDVASVSGITNGQALLWNTANSRFEYGTVASSYGDSDVLSLSEGNWAGNIIPSANVTYDLGSANYRWKDLYLSGNTINLGSTTLSTDGANLSLGSNTLATQNFVTAEINALIGGAPGTLDTLGEIANALNSSNAQLSAVAFSGEYSDVQNRPTIGLVGNSLSYDGTSIDLSSVVGTQGATGSQGPQGNTGPQGVSVTNASLTGSNLIITLSDTTSIDAGNVRGPIGPQGATGATGPQGNIGLTGPQGPQGNVGPQGDGNAGISSATVTAGDLVLTLNDATTINAGNVVGPQGTAGVGITSTSLVGGNLILNYSNTSTQDVGNIQGIQGTQGPQGNAGVDGVWITNATISTDDLVITLSNASTINAGNVRGPIGLTGATGATGNTGPAGNDGTNVSTATVNGSGNLILTLSDASTIDAGNVKGQDGAVDQTLDLTGNVLTISGSNSSVDFTTVLGSFHATNTDAQTLSISGNTITISGSSSSVDLTSALGNVSGGGGSGIADLSGNVISDLGDVSSTTPTDGQALLWDNGNSTWAPGTVSSGGGASALGDLSDVSTSGATSGQVLKYNGTSWAPAADNTGSGGGSGGSTIERFELTYNSNGTLNATQNLSSGISSVVINDSSGGDVTITFDSGFNYPPASILIYGYNYTDNKYNIVPFTTDMGLREIAAGGSSGSPTNFNGSTQQVLKLRLREDETGASRGGFGTVTHAWIQFVMYD